MTDVERPEDPRPPAVLVTGMSGDVLLTRIAMRRTNPYGKSEAERALVVAHHREVEPLLRDWADVELDGTRPVEQLADELVRRLP